jgi:hypothetical protein
VPSRSQPTAVADENEQPGTADWNLSTPAPPDELAAYSRQSSVTAGDRLELAVHSGSSATATLQIYRLGYYGGQGGRLVQRSDPSGADAAFEVAPQPDPEADPSTGLVEARWTTSTTVTVGGDWPSGVYLAKVVRDDGQETAAPFVVRPASGEQHEVLLQIGNATHQAYNDWGNVSLYVDRRFQSARGKAELVSFDRPYAANAGASDVIGLELPLIQWMESGGYDVGYLTSQDLDRDPLPDSTRLFISAGHDEYASAQQRDHLEAALQHGVSLAFLTADAYYWQVRFEDAPDGRERRRVRCVKDHPQDDPLYAQDPQAVTTRFASPLVGRPEAALTGVQYNEVHTQLYNWVVGAAGHWVFDGTDLADGDLVPGVIGLESDALDPTLQPPRGQVILASSPVLGFEHNGAVSLHHAQVYQPDGDGGPFVFSAGSVRFSAALSLPGRADTRVQRIAANLLAHANVLPSHPTFAFGAAAPPAPDTTHAASQVSTLRSDLVNPMGLAVTPDGSLYVADAAQHVLWRLATDGSGHGAVVAGQPGQAGLVDGAALVSQLNRPVGVASDPQGRLLITDAGTGSLRRFDPQSGQVETLVNPSGQQGATPGPGAQAQMHVPAGLAVSPDGTALVTDQGANKIWRVQLDAPYQVTDWADVPGPTGLVWLNGEVLVLSSAEGQSVLKLDGQGQTLGTLAGGQGGGAADGPAGTAGLWPYLGVAVDSHNDLLFSDASSYRVRRLTLSSGEDARVTTYAGSGRHGHQDGAGPQADLILPTGLCADPVRNVLYVSTADGAVRMLTP